MQNVPGTVYFSKVTSITKLNSCPFIVKEVKATQTLTKRYAQYCKIVHIRDRDAAKEQTFVYASNPKYANFPTPR
jgi:hypothetical protein